MKVLVAGWFSFEGMGATAGDLLCRDLIAQWLCTARLPYAVAHAPPFSGGVDWRTLTPADYTHLIFVCGPFGQGWPVVEFLNRFEHCRRIGLNLSMLDRLESWNPFDLLLERDSDCAARPDLTFLTNPLRVPVIGLIQAHRQKEYGDRARHDAAHAALERLLANREAAVVTIDTRLDARNAGGLRTSAEVESLIARMDAVVTTRLHGTVLALKAGVPALAVDPIAGGAKIRRQVEAIGWPVCFLADELNDADLQRALDYCLTEDARERARACRDRARCSLAETQTRVLAMLTSMDDKVQRAG